MYNGEHSIIFCPPDSLEGVNTWDDWHLIPTSRPTMPTPGAQTKYVEIPGMDGSYDISDYLASDIKFSDRSGNFEFVVDNGHENWLTIYRNILTYLHGQRLRMILTDDPLWYWEGRFSLNEWRSEPARSKISIDFRVNPFKRSIYGDWVENVEWDPFNFETDVDYSALWHINVTSTPSTIDIEAYGVRNVLVVRLVSGSSVTASFGGVTKTVTAVGGTAALGISNRIGKTTLTLSGNGVADIGWQKASL